MPRRTSQSGLHPSSEQLRELVARGNAPLQPRRTVAVRPDVLRQLLVTSVDENRLLAAEVRRLEADLRRTSAELATLRADLRGAVHDALTDPLTGLANRRCFDRELKATVSRAGGSSSAYLIIADIDHFKRINDVHGHDIGDRVLGIVGELLTANVRRDTLIARLGGDEFALLMARASPQYAVRIAIRLRDLLASRPLVVRHHPAVTERITLSIGVAGWQDQESGAEWYGRADMAMYQAKRRGRNEVSVPRMLELEIYSASRCKS